MREINKIWKEGFIIKDRYLKCDRGSLEFKWV